MDIKSLQTSPGASVEAAGSLCSTADEIESRLNPICYLCGSPGELLYGSLQDKLFSAPGTWSFRACSDPNCGLIWLDPVPVEEAINRVYAEYYTHAQKPVPQTRFGKVLRTGLSAVFSRVNPVHQERERLHLMYLADHAPGRLLDVGCGNGARLARLRALGWDVRGQDVDPVAVTYARETFGVNAYLGRLEDLGLPEATFDCITLHHVIEHLHDPVALLRECRRLLTPRGFIVIVTPNANSFARKHFGASWRGLEPPRHIHLFSPKTLIKSAERAGLSVRHSFTTAANAKSFGYYSYSMRKGGVVPSTLAGKIVGEIYALGFFYRSVLQHSRDAETGEECVLEASPGNSHA